MARQNGTKINFLGGNNEERIGGNSFIVEHHENGKDVRVMIDLGALFPPEWTGMDAIVPDVRAYFNNRQNKASMPVDAMFISHCHEDHIGGLVHLARAGFEFPPIYTSKFTKELLDIAFKEGGVSAEKIPQVIAVEEGQNVQIADNFTVSPFNVSHSTVGAMGFYMKTTLEGKLNAGIIDPGDYRLGDSPIGPGFDETKFAAFLKDKPVTHVLLDSTSTDNTDEYLVDFETAVNNTVEQIQKHEDKQVISAVISRSLQNMAIDLEAAKQTGRKVFIDGYWAKLAFKAMQKAGIHDYDDTVFSSEDLKNANAQAYLSKYPKEKRYIITSGAFAESKKGKKSGLYKMSEQQKVSVSPKGKIKGKGETGHPDFTIDSYTLVLSRQRCIEAINGKQVRAMYQRLAALGAVVIENKSANNTGKFETALMQRTGHAVRSETIAFIKMILQNRAPANKDIFFVPIHGDRRQLNNTAKVARDAGGMPAICYNTDEIEVSVNGTKKIEGKPLEKQRFISVTENDIGGFGKYRIYDYALVDKDYNVEQTLYQLHDENKPLENVVTNEEKIREKALQEEANTFPYQSNRERHAQEEKSQTPARAARKERNRERDRARRERAAKMKEARRKKNEGY